MITNYLAKIGILAAAFSLPAFADAPATPADNKAIDRIEKKIDRLARTANKQDKAYLDQPLGDRTQGVEFNFFRLLTLGEDESTLSGTYSIFNTQNNTEIAFPIMYSQAEHNDIDNQDLTTFTADAHYRKYLGERLDGFYLSGFARVAHLSGVLGDDSYNSYMNNQQASRTDSETKIGVGVGIGYRIISTSGFYWGASLSVGRYLIGDSDKFYESKGISADIDDEEFIFDIELLKFGYSF